MKNPLLFIIYIFYLSHVGFAQQATTSFQYGFDEDKFGVRRPKTTINDPLGNSKEVFHKGNNITTSTSEFINGQKISTGYSYDGIGQLIEVTDHLGNKTLSLYDNLGRRVQISHPDAGITNLKYDKVNLISRQTQNLAEKNQLINYEYDFSRLIKINYPLNPKNNIRYFYGNKFADENKKGKLILLEDGSGAQEFSYGKQGEITKNQRTLIIPNHAPMTFTTFFEYDTWNRIISITYPDKEKVEYTYNTGGLLESIVGYKGGANQGGGVQYDYIDKIGYDKFEQKIFIQYGNSTQTKYTYYQDAKRWLGNMTSYTGAEGSGSRRIFVNNDYLYDKVGNIRSLKNTAPNSQEQIGGSITHIYTYDDLYRLKTAQGKYSGISLSKNIQGTTTHSYTAQYSLEMEYDMLHNITAKKQHIQRSSTPDYPNGVSAGYELSYTYQTHKPHQVKSIDQIQYRVESNNGIPTDKEASSDQYLYDGNGNLSYVATTKKQQQNTEEKVLERRIFWDEENRMKGLSDNGFVSYYTYDSAGERVLKQSGSNEGVFVNSHFSGGSTNTKKYSLYISPYMVLQNGREYAKHIYAGSQRITSKLGNHTTYQGEDPRRVPKAGDNLDPKFRPNWEEKIKLANAEVKAVYDTLKVPYSGMDHTIPLTICPTCDKNSNAVVSSTEPILGEEQVERLMYYHHPDHLGSSSYITDINGQVVQHLEYVPFGEVFIEERNGSFDNAYKFNAKELDEETGLYYYGARYYNPKTALWINTDPLSGYNPIFETEHYIDGQHNGGIFNPMNMATYSYTYQNPIKWIDPNGKQTLSPNVYNVAFVYYVSGIIPHTSVGYYGKYDRNKGVSYASLSGNSTHKQERIGSDGVMYRGIDEALTIKQYLDDGETVKRYHYKLNDKILKNLSEVIEGESRNPGSVCDALYCTLQAKQAFDLSFENVKGIDDIKKATDKIIPYSLPNDLSNSEALKTGSLQYDIFTKENGKYYKETRRWDPRQVGKTKLERWLGKDGWSSKKVEIKFDDK